MRLIIMFIAIALAAGAFFVTMHFTSSGSGDKPVPVAEPKVIVKEVPTVDVYTAKQDITIGTIIKQDMLDIQPWPEHLLLVDMVQVSNPGQQSKITGMVARTPFQKGEPIIMNRLANDKDPSFLAAALPKGMRVVTIGSDAITGVGGFVFPGDRVDVLLAHDVITEKAKEDTGSFPANNGTNTTFRAPITIPAKKEPMTEILLSNIKVVAVNQKTLAHTGEPPTIPSNITLEVTPEDAQKLLLVQNGNGRLSLALRSLQDKEGIEFLPPTAGIALSHFTPSTYSDSSISVVRGVHSESVEVSRP
jgi:pilus assembly protein CpaB